MEELGINRSNLRAIMLVFDVMLVFLSMIHWLAPKILAVSFLFTLTQVQITRYWWYAIAPYASVLFCMMLSLLFDQIYDFTVSLLKKEHYLPLVLQVLWWIYFIDLLYKSSLHYFAVPFIIYSYCTISAAMIAFEASGILCVISIIIFMYLLLYTTDFLTLLLIRWNRVVRLCDIHFPLLIILYIAIVMNIYNINVK